MTIPSYIQTAGLERYPQNERFAVYRAAHKRLIQNDADYRNRRNSYITGIICLTVLIPIVGWIGAVYLAFRQQKFQNQKIGSVLQAAA